MLFILHCIYCSLFFEVVFTKGPRYTSSINYGQKNRDDPSRLKKRKLRFEGKSHTIPHNSRHQKILKDLKESHGRSLSNTSHHERLLAKRAGKGNDRALGKLVEEGSVKPETAHRVLHDAGFDINDRHIHVHEDYSTDDSEIHDHIHDAVPINQMANNVQDFIESLKRGDPTPTNLQIPPMGPSIPPMPVEGLTPPPQPPIDPDNFVETTRTMQEYVPGADPALDKAIMFQEEIAEMEKKHNIPRDPRRMRGGKPPVPRSQRSAGISIPPLPQLPPVDPSIPKNLRNIPDLSGGKIPTSHMGEEEAFSRLGKNEIPISRDYPNNALFTLTSFGHSSAVAGAAAGEVLDANNRVIEEHNDAMDRSYPQFSPVLFTTEALGWLRNARNSLPDEAIESFASRTKGASLRNGNTPEKADFEARQAAMMAHIYNDNLAKGLKPSVAFNVASNVVEQNYLHAFKNSFIVGGGLRGAQHAADQAKLERESAKKALSVPIEKRPDALKEAAEEHKDYLNRMAQIKQDNLMMHHVIGPMQRAARRMQDSNRITTEANVEANSNPAVKKEILKNIVKQSAEQTNTAIKTLAEADKKEAAMKPKLNALDLLSNAEKQDALDKMNSVNEEKLTKQMQMAKQAKEEKIVKAAEERLAKAKSNEIIAKAGEKAFEKAISGGASQEIAAAERHAAEQEARAQLDRANHERRDEIMKLIGNSGPYEEVKKAAEHIALAHAGMNAVGNTLEEVTQKHEEQLKKEAERNALVEGSEAAKIEVNEIIPGTASKVDVSGTYLNLPLKGFSEETANNEEELVVKNIQKQRRDAVRNKITKDYVESGLNVLKGPKGYMNVPESAKEVEVEDGMVYFPENAKVMMEKEKADTSMLEHKFNLGEREDLDKGVGYYQAKINGFKLPLPSPTNPAPPQVISNGEKSLSLQHATGMSVASGTLIEQPWNDYLKNARPEVNNEEIQQDEMAAAAEMKAKENNMRKLRNLESIETKVYQNPDGSKYVEAKPSYGVTEVMSMEEAINNLKNVGAKGVTALSEEKNKDQEDVLVDMAAGGAGGTEAEFINSVMQEVKGATGTEAEIIDTVNAFTGKVDPAKAAIVGETEAASISMYMSPENTTEATIKNAIITKSEQYAQELNITTEEFANLISSIPPKAINDMMNYNSTNPKDRKEMAEMQFYSEISGMTPKNASVSSIMNVIFNNIATVTNTPNQVTGELLEKIAVPNLAKVQRIDQTKDKNGGITETAISAPNNPTGGNQVLGRVTMKTDPILGVNGRAFNQRINNQPNISSNNNGVTGSPAGGNPANPGSPAGSNPANPGSPAGRNPTTGQRKLNGSGPTQPGSNAPADPRNPLKNPTPQGYNGPKPRKLPTGSQQQQKPGSQQQKPGSQQNKPNPVHINQAQKIVVPTNKFGQAVNQLPQITTNNNSGNGATTGYGGRA